MPYDLYGTYYASRREAEAAELSQMNEIDNYYNRKQSEKLERKQNDVWQYIQMLEERIAALEQKLSDKV